MEEITKTSKTLSEELFQEILARLDSAMLNEKKYLQQDLSMHQLAKELKTNTSYLSRVIQETYHKNFTSYLNAYRINEATLVLANPEYEHYTIDAISKECGYKHKSTFNKAFRKITGITPRKYREHMNE